MLVCLAAALAAAHDSHSAVKCIKSLLQLPAATPYESVQCSAYNFKCFPIIMPHVSVGMCVDVCVYVCM